MIRRPPRSPLFPTTTLSRSQRSMELADLIDAMTRKGRQASFNRRFTEQIQTSSAKASAQIAEGFLRFKATESAYYYRNARARSEEHTSELQSRSDLVCRLLL